ncbi:unnamed protein product [Tetraodon nigroviridis]|uniref:(spotted green pufferfish) hypothetical protein n=1 Tax=Tetraodon nigroviridis TaxID=99883 RepID=Q4RX91_TETNG|nr:unnamed protein product [Tetraodon nigroviridis]
MKLLLPFLLLTLRLSSGYHSPLNDFQRSEGRELVPTSWNSARVTLLSGLNLEECAQRCAQSLDCRAFNYETRPVVTCKHLPWVGDGSNAEVKRNVNCDLYEKKGKAGMTVEIGPRPQARS